MKNLALKRTVLGEEHRNSGSNEKLLQMLLFGCLMHVEALVLRRTWCAGWPSVWIAWKGANRLAEVYLKTFYSLIKGNFLSSGSALFSFHSYTGVSDLSPFSNFLKYSCRGFINILPFLFLIALSIELNCL